MKRKIRIKYSMLTILGLVVLGAILAGPIMSDVEIPNYEVIFVEDNIEMRQYDAMIIAETSVQGERDEAIREGFRLIADFIFGNNTKENEISMTAPVQQQGQNIAMTAPVQQQSLNGLWNVSFIMPSKYTMESLPKPNNDKVNIVEIPPQKYIVVRFSGTNSSGNISKHESILKEYMLENNIKIIGGPKYAFYNPPWMLPFMRRNEIMFQVN